jgi:Smg protein
MFDILMFLFESYSGASQYPDAGRLSLKLTVAGFEDDDIHSALHWLAGLEQLSAANYPDAINQAGMRCYTADEIRKISLEARRFLLHWEQSGMISAVEREMIIDRALAIGRDDLPLDKVKLIALMVLWNRHEQLDALLVEELMASDEPSAQH